MRASGIFLHPTSLPSPYGIGDLGGSAYRWVDLLSANFQSYWQFCPLGPTGYGDSPYQSLCSFAGNTLLISPDELHKEGLITEKELESYPAAPDESVDFGLVSEQKEKLFRKAYLSFKDSDEFLRFCADEKWWLDDYAFFRVIKANQKGRPWWEWDSAFKLRQSDALESVRENYAEDLRYQKFLQFTFYSQWKKLYEYASSKNLKLIGDIPYYTAYDSSDTWAEPSQFEFDEDARPVRVAGVPPDYFSETGQLWGNPLYRWDVMKRDGYRWWTRRIRKTLELVDYIRLDHFRAFDSYWAIPADSPTAVTGEWVEGPGIHFFDAIKSRFGELPFIAEDLGDITPDVTKLREQIAAPGMKILQFAFDANPTNPYLPYNISQDSVTYTGTHDNDTSLGWFSQLSEAEKKRVCDYLGCTEDAFMDHFLRCAYGTPSWLCIVPFQDVLELYSKHRMNTPGTLWGNWQWRFTESMPLEEKMKKISELTLIYGRAPGSGYCL
ncbi:MAG: 4-alpha-glucanotransferase [Fibrobacterota bacterium]